jgi:hypothetical protein
MATTHIDIYQKKKTRQDPSGSVLHGNRPSVAARLTKPFQAIGRFVDNVTSKPAILWCKHPLISRPNQ